MGSSIISNDPESAEAGLLVGHGGDSDSDHLQRGKNHSFSLLSVLKTSPFTFLAALSLLAYHQSNFSFSESTATLRSWFASFTSIPMAVHHQGKTVLSVSVPSAEGFHSNLSNSSDKRLAEWGQVFRYSLGNRPARYAKAESRGWEWYFLRDEFPFQFESAKPRVEKSLEGLAGEIVSTFEKLGAQVVLVPMPTKVSVLRSKLPATLGSAHWVHSDTKASQKENPEAVYQSALSAIPDRTVNVLQAFTQFQTQNPDKILYGASDTRISALAGVITAREIVNHLAQRGIASPASQIVESAEPGKDSEMLLLDLLQLPNTYRGKYPQTQWKEPLYTLSAPQDKAPGKVVILGTCDSARLKDTPHGIGPLIASATGKELHDYSQAGGKTVPAFEAMVKEKTAIQKGDTVIWQFNLRETFDESDKQKILKSLKQILETSQAKSL